MYLTPFTLLSFNLMVKIVFRLKEPLVFLFESLNIR